MRFLDIFGGYHIVNSPNFNQMRVVCIFLRALLGVYLFSKILAVKTELLDILRLKMMKKRTQKLTNFPITRILFLLLLSSSSSS